MIESRRWLERDPVGRVGPCAVVVGAPMALARRHVTGDALADGERVGKAQNSAYSAHVS